MKLLNCTDLGNCIGLLAMLVVSACGVGPSETDAGIDGGRTGGGAAGGGAAGGSGGGSGGGSAVIAERLLYIKSTTGLNKDVFTSAIDGSSPLQLTTGEVRIAQWSGDGSRILYAARVDAGSLTYFSMNADGGSKSEVLAIPNSYEPGPWSPDGQRLLLMKSGAGTMYDIFSINADGSNLKAIAATAATEGAPAWSPDSQSIVYKRDLELWLVDREGTNARKLGGPYPQMYTPSPAWSRQGDLIAFSIGDFEADLYTIHLDGSGFTQRTSAPGGEYEPSFSADGTRIACYHFENTSAYGIYVVGADGGAVTQLVPRGQSPQYR